MDNTARVIPIQQPPLALAPEPRFLRENWKLALAQNSGHRDEELRFVRILGGIANIASRSVLLRCPLDLPNGTYTIDANNELQQTWEPHWLGYPDVELCRPQFERMAAIPFPKNIIDPLVKFLEEIRQVRGLLGVNKNGFFFYQNPSAPNCRGFPMPNIQRDLCFDPQSMKLALKEMLRYDGDIFLGQEDRPGKEMPLFIGIDWDRCALVMPSR